MSRYYVSGFSMLIVQLILINIVFIVAFLLLLPSSPWLFTLITALLIMLTITYSARVALVNSIIKTQLSLVQAQVTCLDVSLTRNITIVVNKLCLNSPKADIKIVKADIELKNNELSNLKTLKVVLKTLMYA